MKNKKKIIFAGYLILLLITCGCAPHFHIDFMGEETIQEVVLLDREAKDKILVIDLNGVIATNQDMGLFDKNGDLLSKIYYRLQKAAKDRAVKGIILRIDTPGGEITASDILYKEISRFRQETGRPVIAMMMGTATSGGYYVACGCDVIIAHPTTITGSIGVIAVLPGFEGVLDKIGIEMNVIKSGPMKDAGSPFKKLEAEEREYIQAMIDNMYHRFLQVVYNSRKADLTMEDIKKLADGRVYTATDALESKLIDQVGYFDDAVQRVLSEAKIKKANVVAYTYHPGRKTNIYANVSAVSPGFALFPENLQHLLPMLKTGFYYIWLPSGK